MTPKHPARGKGAGFILDVWSTWPQTAKGVWCEAGSQLSDSMMSPSKKVWDPRRPRETGSGGPVVLVQGQKGGGEVKRTMTKWSEIRR